MLSPFFKTTIRELTMSSRYCPQRESVGLHSTLETPHIGSTKLVDFSLVRDITKTSKLSQNEDYSIISLCVESRLISEKNTQPFLMCPRKVGQGNIKQCGGKCLENCMSRVAAHCSAGMSLQILECFVNFIVSNGMKNDGDRVLTSPETGYVNTS
ncbi:hypothetical protein TNCV_925641 [Trichonephila clavipes]|nr:hypothetical protein TNCV_925641 [Trichonephila clavipes]